MINLAASRDKQVQPLKIIKWGSKRAHLSWRWWWFSNHLQDILKDKMIAHDLLPMRPWCCCCVSKRRNQKKYIFAVITGKNIFTLQVRMLSPKRWWLNLHLEVVIFSPDLGYGIFGTRAFFSTILQEYSWTLLLWTPVAELLSWCLSSTAHLWGCILKACH